MSILLPLIAGVLGLWLLVGWLSSVAGAVVKLSALHFHPEHDEALERSKNLAWACEHAERVMRLTYYARLLLFVVMLLVWVVYDAWNWAQHMGPLDVTHWQYWISWVGGLVALVGYLAAFFTGRELGYASPTAVLRRGALAMRLLDTLFRPLDCLVMGAVTLLLKAFKQSAPSGLGALDLAEQIERMEEESPEMSLVAQKILKNALSLRELVVSDVLLPRHQVKFWNLHESLEANLQMARECGHTRYPLCLGDLDRCQGLIHIKDLFRYTGDLKQADFRSLKREIIRVDSEEPLEEALTKLLAHRMHMALVIDEFRAVEGVLSLERILEQLVGDIRDEFDADEELLIRSSNAVTGEMMVSGLTPLHELGEQLGVEFDTEAVSTLGGLITTELGRIPDPGEQLFVEGVEVIVTKVDDKRVIEAQVRALD